MIYKPYSLPSPTRDKSGWPWIKSGQDFPLFQPNGERWPKVSIITPSFNQAQYLEETLRSVLLQGYPNLEYIVLDGGSTDLSVDILQKYSPFLNYWRSHKDSGQSDAINQGLRMATGEIIGWLNSDDSYLEDTFQKTIPLFNQPEISCVYGKAFFSDENSQIYDEYPSYPLAEGWKRMRFWQGWPVPQPTVLFRRKLLESYGYLNGTLKYGLDYDLFIRFLQYIPFHFIDEYLATYRIHANSKSGDWSQHKIRFYKENLRANLRYASPFLPQNWLLWLSFTKYLAKALGKRALNLFRPNR